MALILKACLISVFLVLTIGADPIRVRRQFWADDFDYDTIPSFSDTSSTPQTVVMMSSNRPRDRQLSDNRRSTTSTTSTTTLRTTTKPSDEHSACMDRCPSTPQYNPVCGSNRITYPNENRLNCAIKCGLRIRKLFGGTCLPIAVWK